MDRLEFSACGSPTGLDLRDPYDLHVGEYYDLLSLCICLPTSLELIKTGICQ